jgi:hypothetical protein
MNRIDGKAMAAQDNDGQGRAASRGVYSDSWSACRVNIRPEEKRLMADYFAEHDFLVPFGENGETQERGRAAHVFVAPGTGPNAVVKACLGWVRHNWKDGPCTFTWYPLGGLIPALLFEFKQKYGRFATGAKMFMLPGEVDAQSGTLTGKYIVEFLKGLAEDKSKEFNLSILSAYRFNMATGDAYFYFDNEIEPQCLGAARLYAEEKALFLDNEKFSSIGGSKGYNIRDLLETSRSVTIYTYTADSEQKDRVKKLQFEKLADRLLVPCPKPTDEEAGKLKRLRLCIVDSAGEASFSRPRNGVLISAKGCGPDDRRPDVTDGEEHPRPLQSSRAVGPDAVCLSSNGKPSDRE